VHEGVWLWSWAAPAALQAPFLSPAAPAALTRPAAYYAPARWAGQPVLAGLHAAPGAILVRIDEKGMVTSHRLEPRQLAEPARLLARAAAADPHLAWREFIATLPDR
jgi:hypothetical protein